MQSQGERLELLDQLVTAGVELGVGHCDAEDDHNDGRHVRIRDRELVNFASCSYLGLEIDPRLIKGAIEAVKAHGIQMCSSRVFLSSPLYAEFESLVEEIFRAHVVVTATTTLGHLSALPALVGEDDAIVMDHQVHTSVQMAASFVHGSGAHLEFVRHNDLDRLEERVAELSKLHRQVWYMADGVYSMFGDFAPTRELRRMLDRQPQMRFYVDDAHGMSWCGPRGVGSVLNRIDLHPRMVLATGLGKGFGTGGGLIILPDAEQKRRVRTCGPTMLFCGPLQPAILGAAIASAKIHLSDEIDDLQAELRDRMDLCNALFADHGLPIISSPETPIGFIGTGPTQACHNLCARLLDEGLYTNPAQFPATPVRRSGGRFLLTRHHEVEDIERLASSVAKHWEPALRDAGTTADEVWATFDLEPPVSRHRKARPSHDPSLFLESTESIDKLDRREWDSLLGRRGCLGSSALSLFETSFGPEQEDENSWAFRYYIVRDSNRRPLLATCFSSALWKADMLSPAAVSEEIEKRRLQDPHYLTQRVFSMGCLLSEGNHLWLREPASCPISRSAIRLLLDSVRVDARELGCSVRILRDFPNADSDIHTVLEEEGLFRMAAPDSLVLSEVHATDSELISRLARKHRYHQQRYVQPFNDEFRVEVVASDGRRLKDGDIEHLFVLYENVRRSSLELNTFGLPREAFVQMANSPDWEILLFRTKSDAYDRPVGFLASYRQEDAYIPLIAGLDYDMVREKGLYRQVLRHAVIRAHDLGLARVYFGLGASLEKRRFGARPESASMFVEADDHFAFDTLAQLTSDTRSGG